MAKQLQSKRILEQAFLNDLKDETDGILNPILQAVHDDNNLILEIRQNYINIYYRGGNLLKVAKSNNSYTAEFNPEYCKNKKYKERIKEIIDVKKIISKNDSIHWVSNFSYLKQIMDYHHNSKENIEKEFQQLVVRENNIMRAANDTDYYIIDFEYTSSVMNDARFDLIALKWDSTSNDRKNPNNCQLAIIEMKYGDNALSGESGIESHIKDVDKFLSNKEYLENFKTEMLDIFNQKRDLGLIRFGIKGNKNIVSSILEKPEMIFIFAAHKPAKKNLKIIIDKLKQMEYAELKFATSSFMGYSLYKENILSLAEFKKLLKE